MLRRLVPYACMLCFVTMHTEGKTVDVPVLGSGAAKLREDMRTQQEAPALIDAVTAFLVYITPDGRYIMDTDLDSPVTTARTPTRHEIIAACANVSNDTRRQMQSEEVTMTILGNLSRMQADPNYHMAVEQARAQASAAAAAAAAAGNGRKG